MSGDYAELLRVMREIALGKEINGKPLNAEEARQRARAVLIAGGWKWSKPRVTKVEQ